MSSMWLKHLSVDVSSGGIVSESEESSTTVSLVPLSKITSKFLFASSIIR